MQCHFYQLEEQILHVEDLLWSFYIHYYNAHCHSWKEKHLSDSFYLGRKKKNYQKSSLGL